MTRFDVIYIAELMRTIAITTVSVWSLASSALNIWPTEAVSISTVDFSFMVHVKRIAATKMIATISAKYLKPARSISFTPVAPAMRPSFCTQITVPIVMIAEPTPAQDLASVVRFSRSFPPSVKAGIIDQ